MDANLSRLVAEEIASGIPKAAQIAGTFRPEQGNRGPFLRTRLSGAAHEGSVRLNRFAKAKISLSSLCPAQTPPPRGTLNQPRPRNVETIHGQAFLGSDAADTSRRRCARRGAS